MHHNYMNKLWEVSKQIKVSVNDYLIRMTGVSISVLSFYYL